MGNYFTFEKIKELKKKVTKMQFVNNYADTQEIILLSKK